MANAPAKTAADLVRGDVVHGRGRVREVVLWTPEGGPELADVYFDGDRSPVTYRGDLVVVAPRTPNETPDAGDTAWGRSK